MAAAAFITGSPIGIGHVGHQNIARLHLIHLRGTFDHARLACRNLGADTLPRKSPCRVFQFVDFVHQHILAACNRFRPCLHNKQVARNTVLAHSMSMGRGFTNPGNNVFDDDGLFGQRQHFVIAEAETF